MVPPSTILIDTCFAYSALGRLEDEHVPCREFLERAAEGGTTLVFSELLEVELHEVAWKVALKERWGGHWQTRRADGRARRRAGRLSTGILRGWHDVLDAFDHVRIEVAEVRDDYPRIMRRWGIASYDAVHIATAEYVGVTSIATHDTGMANAPQRLAQLYAPKSYVRRMRHYRGGPKP